MYVGRLCLVGVSKRGTLVAAYLLSSKTYFERDISIQGATAKVILRKATAKLYPPELFYDCIEIINLGQRSTIVVGNGSHTDSVEKMISCQSNMGSLSQTSLRP